jgi:hypothetical protein
MVGSLETNATPAFFVILNEVNDLNLLKMRDSSLRSDGRFSGIGVL